MSETAYHDLMEQAISCGVVGDLDRPDGQPAARRRRSPSHARPTAAATTTAKPAGRNADSAEQRSHAFVFATGMLTQIDQYNPERAAAVRQKLTDLGVNNNNNVMNMANQMRNGMLQATSDSLMTAASSAPPQAQSFSISRPPRRR